MNLVKKAIPIIAGPCAFESEAQMLALAKELRQLPGLCALRAGVWKPRTLPSAFEGYGAEALKTLTEIQNTYDIPTAVEVGLVEQVDACAAQGIKILWLGARSVCAPELVEALFKRISEKIPDAQVIIKNPYANDFKLWEGAVRRAIKWGIVPDLCFRGVKTGTSVFRNAPLWNWVEDMKKLFPQCKMYLDPSHLYGSREIIRAQAPHFKNLGLFDGYIIECHAEPELAKTDAGQQLTPAELLDLVKVLNDKDSIGTQAVQELQTLRSQIDEIDTQLLRLLGERQKVSQAVAHNKERSGKAIYDKQRYFDVLRSRLAQGLNFGLSTSFVESLFTRIHDESVAKQFGEMLSRKPLRINKELCDEKNTQVQRV